MASAPKLHSLRFKCCCVRFHRCLAGLAYCGSLEGLLDGDQVARGFVVARTQAAREEDEDRAAERGGRNLCPAVHCVCIVRQRIEGQAELAVLLLHAARWVLGGHQSPVLSHGEAIHTSICTVLSLRSKYQAREEVP